MHRHRYPFGMTALGLSFFALMLSIFPSWLLERKLAALEQLCADTASSFSFACGKAGCVCESDLEQCTAEMRGLRHRLRCCKFCLPLAALAAVGAAVRSWRKERAKELCLFSIAAVAVALSWRHIGAAAAVSTALAVFIILLAVRFSSEP